MLSLLAVLTAAFLACHWAVEAHKYTVEFKKDSLLDNCNLDGFTDIDEIFDMSGMKFSRDDNDQMVTSGSFKLRKDVGVLQIQLEGKKFDRGNWVPVLAMKKPDYCMYITSLKDGAEFVFQGLQPKRCPFDTDTVYTMEPKAIDMSYETPYPNGQGEYVIYAKLFNEEKNIAACAKIPCDVR